MDPIILEATPGKPPTTSSPPPPKATKPEEIVLLEEMLYIPLPAEEQSSKRSMIEPSADWEVRATASAITRNDVVPKAEIELL
jgi:hypothetical protein